MLNFSATTIRWQRIDEITATSHTSRLIVENIGSSDAPLVIVDVVPKRLVPDAQDIDSDSNLEVLERDPIVVRYAVARAGGKLERTLRFPTGGEDIRHITLVLEGPLSRENEPEEFRVLYRGAMALAQVDYSKLTAAQVEEINRQFNAALNNQDKPLLERLKLLATEAQRLSEKYALEVTGVGEAPLLLEASELIPGALVRIPFEYLRLKAGITDASDEPLVRSAVEGKMCEKPARCEVRPGAGETWELFVDLRGFSNGLPDELEGSLPVYSAREPDKPVSRVPILLRVNHVSPQDRVFAAPRKIALANSSAAQQMVYAFNNLAVPAKAEGCGISSVLAPSGGSASAAVSAAGGSCAVSLAGVVSEAVDVLASEDAADLRNSSEASSWRDCADSFCSCEPLPNALHSMVGRFLGDASLVLGQENALEVVRRLQTSTLFSQGYLVRGLKLGDCVLPKELAAFTTLTLPPQGERSVWLVGLSMDLAKYYSLDSMQKRDYNNYLQVTVRNA